MEEFIEQEYENSLARYQEIKYAFPNSNEHKEKLLLAHLIAEYEEKTSELPQVDPVELIKIRMKDFGYKSVEKNKWKRIERDKQLNDE